VFDKQILPFTTLAITVHGILQQIPLCISRQRERSKTLK